MHLDGVPVLARGLGVRLPRRTWVRYRVNCSAGRLSVRVGERWVLRNHSLPGWAIASGTDAASNPQPHPNPSALARAQAQAEA